MEVIMFTNYHPKCPNYHAFFTCWKNASNLELKSPRAFSAIFYSWVSIIFILMTWQFTSKFSDTFPIFLQGVVVSFSPYFAFAVQPTSLRFNHPVRQTWESLVSTFLEKFSKPRSCSMLMLLFLPNIIVVFFSGEYYFQHLVWYEFNTKAPSGYRTTTSLGGRHATLRRVMCWTGFVQGIIKNIFKLWLLPSLLRKSHFTSDGFLHGFGVLNSLLPCSVSNLALTKLIFLSF